MFTLVNTMILGFGVYLVLTAKAERVPRETYRAKNKDSVKTAIKFEVQDQPKKRGRPLGSKNKKTSAARKENRTAVKKTSRRVV